MQVGSLGQEDPLEEEMTTHCSILAWKIPRTEEPGKLQSMWSQRFSCNWAHVYTTLSKMGVFCLLWLFARVFFWGGGGLRGVVCLLLVFITFATSSGLSQLGVQDSLPSKQPCVVLITPQRWGLLNSRPNKPCVSLPFITGQQDSSFSGLSRALDIPSSILPRVSTENASQVDRNPVTLNELSSVLLAQDQHSQSQSLIDL